MSDNKRNNTFLNFGLNIGGQTESLYEMKIGKSGKGEKESLLPKNPSSNIQNFEGSLKAQPVILPRNYYRPYGSDSLDLRNLVNVPAATVNKEYFRFTAPKSSSVVITHYAIFTDILLANNVDFIPRVNGNRVLRYHGDPNNKFKLNLSVSVDLSQNALIPCEITLQAGQTLTWSFSNTSGADAPMGVRIVGYVDNVTQNASTGFGG